MLPKYFCFLLIILHITQNEFVFCARFVNKRIRDRPTRLTNDDYQRRSPPDQRTDTAKILRPDLVEGDIAESWRSFTRTVDVLSVSPHQRDFVAKSAIRDKNKQWPNNIVPYVISSRYLQNARTKIAKAFKYFEKYTCVRFVPRTTDRDYVYIRPSHGCYSHVGRVGGEQEISLDNECFIHGVILHELMHTLGFFHEHNRNDRGDYIQIHWTNIERGASPQFRKRSLATIDHLDTPYDYGSIMHYPLKAFSVDGYSQTIVPRRRTSRKIGQRVRFSYWDLERIKLLYCSARRPQTEIQVEPLPPERRPRPATQRPVTATQGSVSLPGSGGMTVEHLFPSPTIRHVFPSLTTIRHEFSFGGKRRRSGRNRNRRN